jgi:voltage-gated potassium channel
MSNKKLSQLLFIIPCLVWSPTRLIIECWLESCSKAEEKAQILMIWNETLLSVEVLISLLFWLFSITPYYLHYLLSCLLFWFAFSRCNEIFYAFYCDSLDKIDKKETKTSLKPSQRIRLAIRSYGSLTLNFGFIHFLLPYSMYEPRFDNIVDALYFSGVTIATLGYGDIKPTHFLSKLFCVYEVFSGILLVVIAIAVYVGSLGNRSDKSK